MRPTSLHRLDPLHPKARTSSVLTLLAEHSSERLTVEEILAVLRGRAYALLVVLLGLPNCLPMPPPIPLLCGLLLALVAAQIAAGWSYPWLPQALLRRSMARADVIRAVDRAMPALLRLERWSRPRMTVFETAVALRLIGFLLLTLAIGLIFAAPVVGQIPLGIAVCLVGLGLVERDGILVMAGVGIGVIGLALSFGFVWAIVSGVVSLF